MTMPKTTRVRPKKRRPSASSVRYPPLSRSPAPSAVLTAGERRDHALPGGRAGGVEDAAQEDEGQELPEGEAHGVVEQRDGRHARAARQVRKHAGAPESEAVHDGAAEEARKDGGQERRAAREAGPGGAAGGLQHEPGDGDERQGVAREGDGVGEEQREEGDPSLCPRAGT